MMEYRLNFENKFSYRPKKADKDLVCYTLVNIDENVKFNEAIDVYGMFKCYSTYNKQKKSYDCHCRSYAFYGFKYPEDLITYARKHKKKFPQSFKIMECIIPKKTRYAEGIFADSDFEGYVSNTYINKDVICEWHGTDIANMWV